MAGSKESSVRQEAGPTQPYREARPVTAMGGAVIHRLAFGRTAPPMDAKHVVLRRAQRAGPGRNGSPLKPWLRGDAKAAALFFSVSSVPLCFSVSDQFLNPAVSYKLGSMRASSRAVRARVTLARMSFADAVQMKGFGEALCFSM